LTIVVIVHNKHQLLLIHTVGRWWEVRRGKEEERHYKIEEKKYIYVCMHTGNVRFFSFLCWFLSFLFSLLLSKCVYMCMRCHRIDIIIEFPFSFSFFLSRSLLLPVARWAIASKEIQKKKKKEKIDTDRSWPTPEWTCMDMYTYTFVYIYICVCVCVRENDDDCHFSDNVPRCSYNKRILYRHQLTQMSKLLFLFNKKICTRIYFSINLSNQF